MTSQLSMTPICDVNWTLGDSAEPDATAACVFVVSWVILIIIKR